MMEESKAAVPSGTSKAMVPVGRMIDLSIIQAAQAIAPLAGMYMLTPEQATLAMLKGYELGLGLIASLDLIYVIQTRRGLRPALSTQGINALIQRSGVLCEFKVEDTADDKGPVGCTVRMTRADSGFTYEVSFTLKDAERAELLSKDNWKKWPAEMLRARAISTCGRIVCPDVLAGLYLADELGAVTDAQGIPVDAIVVEGTYEHRPPETSGAPGSTPPERSQPLKLSDLVGKYGPDVVWAASGGKLPSTQAEIDEVAKKLAEGKEEADG